MKGEGWRWRVRVRVRGRPEPEPQRGPTPILTVALPCPPTVTLTSATPNGRSAVQALLQCLPQLRIEGSIVGRLMTRMAEVIEGRQPNPGHPRTIRAAAARVGVGNPIVRCRQSNPNPHPNPNPNPKQVLEGRHTDDEIADTDVQQLRDFSLEGEEQRKRRIAQHSLFVQVDGGSALGVAEVRATVGGKVGLRSS